MIKRSIDVVSAGRGSLARGETSEYAFGRASKDGGLMSSEGPHTGPSPSEVAELVGIIESPPCGVIAAQGNRIIIGAIILDEHVEIVPCEDIEAAHWDVLRGYATQALLGHGDELPGWEFVPGIGWHADVTVGTHSDGRVLRARSAALRSSDVAVVVPATGSTVPSGR